MKTIIAIDPGVGGGIAWQSNNGVFAMPMPQTEGQIIAALRFFAANNESHACYLEEVGKGIIPGRAKAMITLNVNAAVCRTALACFGIKTIMVRPQDWQPMFHLGSRAACATSTIWKNKLRAEAERRFPEIEVTLATSDALLLLEYGRMQK